MQRGRGAVLRHDQQRPIEALAKALREQLIGAVCGKALGVVAGVAAA